MVQHATGLNLLAYQQKDSTFVRCCLGAEAGGFEPPVRLPVRQFSKLVVSATHPNFQSLSAFVQKRCKSNAFFYSCK